MVLLAAFLTQVGALQTAPILIAVVTAFLTMEAVKYLVATPQAGARSRGETSNTELRVLEIDLGQDRRGADAVAECDQLAAGFWWPAQIPRNLPEDLLGVRYGNRSSTGRSRPTVG